MVRSLAILTIAACVTTPARAAEGRFSVAVLDLTASGVEANVAHSLTAVIGSELSKFALLEVITRDEISQILIFEEQRQLLGCDDVTCLAEIGGALGVGRLVTGSIGRVGEGYVISLQLVDISTVKVENRVQRQTDSPNQLVRETGLAARQLVMEILQQLAGQLLVRSAEEGASLFVDGALVGVTPVGVLKLSAGPHDLRVTKRGFVDWAKTVEVSPQATEAIEINLSPSQSFIDDYVSRNRNLRLWAWALTAAAATTGATAAILFTFADQVYYPNGVSPLRNECNNHGTECNEAYYALAEQAISTYQAQLYTVYALTGLTAALTGAAIYCWFVGEDPSRYDTFVGSDATPRLGISPTPNGALLGLTVGF